MNATRWNGGAKSSLVPERYSEHWQLTLRFLEVLTQQWPGVLAAERAIDPAERRNAVIRAYAAMWRKSPPEAPLIAAGSTGTVPATAELLETIAGETECPCQRLRDQFPVSKATISHHIKELVRAGLVDARKEGQYLHCEVRRDVLSAYTAELLRRVSTIDGVGA